MPDQCLTHLGKCPHTAFQLPDLSFEGERIRKALPKNFPYLCSATTEHGERNYPAPAAEGIDEVPNGGRQVILNGSIAATPLISARVACAISDQLRSLADDGVFNALPVVAIRVGGSKPQNAGAMLDLGISIKNVGIRALLADAPKKLEGVSEVLAYRAKGFGALPKIERGLMQKHVRTRYALFHIPLAKIRNALVNDELNIAKGLFEGVIEAHDLIAATRVPQKAQSTAPHPSYALLEDPSAPNGTFHREALISKVVRDFRSSDLPAPDEVSLARILDAFFQMLSERASPFSKGAVK